MLWAWAGGLGLVVLDWMGMAGWGWQEGGGFLSILD